MPPTLSINKTCSVRQRGIAGWGIRNKTAWQQHECGQGGGGEKNTISESWGGVMTHLHAGGWTSREHEEDAGKAYLHEKGYNANRGARTMWAQWPTTVTPQQVTHAKESTATVTTNWYLLRLCTVQCEHK